MRRGAVKPKHSVVTPIQEDENIPIRNNPRSERILQDSTEQAYEKTQTGTSIALMVEAIMSNREMTPF